MTMASVGSAVQAACRKAREEALARGGANDLDEAMRRLGWPVEVMGDAAPGDGTKRFSMHAFGAVFVEVAVDPDLGETRVRRIVGAYGAGRIVNPKQVAASASAAGLAASAWRSWSMPWWMPATAEWRTPISPNMPSRSTPTPLRSWMCCLWKNTTRM